MIIFSAACLVFPFCFHSPVKIHQQLLQVPIPGDQWKHGHRMQSVAQGWISICVSLTLFSLLLGVKGTYSTYSRIKKRINPPLLCFTVFGIWNQEIMLNSVILIMHTHKKKLRPMVNLWHRSLFWMAHRAIWDSPGKFYGLKIHLQKTKVSSFFWNQWNYLRIREHR